MATIRDVAARAGVSLGTASRVLAGSAATSASARERVAAAVTELGYVPNARAGSLRRARTDTVGILVSDVRNPFFAELAHAAEQEALRRGSVVVLANADEDAEQELTYLRVFGEQRVDGILLAPQSSDADRYVRAAAARPLVMVDRTVDGAGVPCVAADNEGGIRQALDALTSRGHRRIGYVGGPTVLSTGAERRRAFLDERAGRGLDDDARLVEEGDFRPDSGGRALARMLDAGASPTAVVAADGLMAMGVLAELRRRGLRDRIEVLSFDDLPWFGEVEPPVSAIANDATEMGRLSMNLLLDVVGSRQGAGGAQPDRIVVPTRLVDRFRGSGA